MQIQRKRKSSKDNLKLNYAHYYDFNYSGGILPKYYVKLRKITLINVK